MNHANFPDATSSERILKENLVWPDKLKAALKKHFKTYSKTNKASKTDVQAGLQLISDYLFQRFGVSPVCRPCRPHHTHHSSLITRPFTRPFTLHWVLSIARDEGLKTVNRHR